MKNLLCYFLTIVATNATLKGMIHSSKYIVSKQEHEKNLNFSEGPTNPLYTILWACRYGSGTAYITDGWEGDYIRELFPFPQYYHTQNVNASARTVVYNTLSDLSFLQSYISSNQVLVLVHLADEYQGLLKISSQGTALYKLVPLVLRQYSFHIYRKWVTPLSNVLQIPLGYMTGMFYSNQTKKTFSSIHVALKTLNEIDYEIKRNRRHRPLDPSIDILEVKPAPSKRVYNWSFVGNPNKSDRPHMLQVFSSWGPFLSSNSLSPTETAAVYKQSKFVIVGRGQFSIDCFRIYEALINGAIPVVVTDEQDIQNSFEYDGNRPPFLFAQSWEDALEVCRSMSAQDIKRKRSAIMKWYIRRLRYIQHRIQHILQVFTNLPQYCPSSHGGSCEATLT